MDRRTTLITAAAVGAALLVGSGAVAANIGVLNSAQDDSIGSLTAATAVEQPPSSIVDVSDGAPQEFTIETAGSVTVEQTATGLFVSDVQANDGWNWTTEQTGANDLSVTFVSGDTTYEFVASLGADGLVAARVDQPILDVVQSPAPSNGSNGSYESDDHSGDDHDQVDHNDDHQDHKGGEDDD